MGIFDIFRGSAKKDEKKIDAKELSDKAAALTASGRHKDAIVCYDKALKIDPDLAFAWFNKAKSFSALGRADEATTCIRKAANLGLAEAQKACEQSGTLYKQDDLDADARIKEGIALGKLGQWQEALNCHCKALEITPTNSKAWLNKGQVLRKLERRAEAVESLKQFLKYANPAKDVEIMAAVKNEIARLKA